jgi:Protein of unknown function (DUF803).
MPEASQSGSWAVGVTLGLLGSIAINTGNNIQSLALKSLNGKGRKYRPGKPKTVPIDDEGESVDEADKSVPNPCSSSLWIIGTVIFITGSLLNFVSYAFAAQSMLASLESVQFVTNLLFGKFMLRAEITQKMMYGTLLTVLGTIVAVQFSSKATLSLNIAELVQLYRNPSYIAYLALMFITMIILSCIYKKYNKQKLRGRQLPRTEIIMPLCYSLWSALCGTQSVVQAKILAELLAVQASGAENIFKSVLLYVTIILWLITAGIWLSRLNDSLRVFDPLFIIPMLQCSFIFFAIISGGIFFREFDTFSWSQWLGFWGGVFVMFAGLRLLTPEQEDGDKDNAKQDAEEEENEDEVAGREGCTTLKTESSPQRIVNLPTKISINPTTAGESSDNQTKTHASPLFFASLRPSNSDKQPNGTSESECDTMGSVDFLPQLLDESAFKSPPPTSMSFDNNNLDYNRSSWNSTSDASSSSSTNASSTTSSSRKMRQSLTAAALKAIKDTLVESTQNMVTNMSGSALLTPPNGTAILTKAITEANEIKEKRLALKLKKLKRLQEMTETTIHEPRNFLVEETFQLIQALNIDVGFALPEHFDLEAVQPSIASPSDFRENIYQKVTNLIQVINDGKQYLTSQMESVD